MNRSSSGRSTGAVHRFENHTDEQWDAIQHPLLVVGLMLYARTELSFPKGLGLDHTKSAFSDIVVIPPGRLLCKRTLMGFNGRLWRIPTNQEDCLSRVAVNILPATETYRIFDFGSFVDAISGFFQTPDTSYMRAQAAKDTIIEWPP